MSYDQARDEVERRIAIIADALRAQPPTKIDVLDHPLEDELERKRLALNDNLREAQILASKLRELYHAKLDR